MFDLFNEQNEGMPQSRRHFLNQIGAAFAIACLPQLALGAESSKKMTRRIVSVGGGLTEIIYALGAEKELVGVDTTSLYPEAATKLPSVGYARALSSEGILALSPTLVLATEDAGPPAVLRQVGTAGVPVSILSANDKFEGVIERIQHVGRLIERSAQASQLESQLRQDWQRALAPILARKTSAPRVLFILSHSPAQIMVGGRKTSADAMIAYAGARNAVDGFDGFKPLTPEAVIAAQPDIVLFTEQGMGVVGGVDGALKLPGLAQTPAGQKRRMVALEAMFMLGFGPRLPQALSALDQLLTKAMQG
ncbi:hemin ABC transporter substrate-binding protein [Methylophilus sp. TWE2]|uniref:heme/hemin ABC transporter substrate-binding protein n=1 Tax=Methylophilus sp. TWE2 TaxID=1662285 RepID=UPI000671695B|nr:hemin ABC transporter substrate-binding protein [Methylophilus sp. TWE2]AKR44089.1 ABC transporter substrate-binding protein [Methylophilus sp. TWE2]